MSDTPNPAPAGAGDAPARLSENDLLEQLGRFGDDGSLYDGDTSAEEEPKEEAEPTEPEADDAPAGDDEATEDEGSEDEGPEDDASEPEQDDDAEAKTPKDEKFLVSRDGKTKVPHSEAWTAIERAREFDRVLPKIQQEYQGFQQVQQQFQAEKQQFQLLAKGVAQIAEELLPSEPDPALMDENSGKYDPILFMQQQHRRATAQANLNNKLGGAALALKQDSERAKQQTEAQVHALRTHAYHQFVQYRPEMASKEGRDAFEATRHRVAQRLRFSQQEIYDIQDARLLEALRLADIGASVEDERAKAKVTKTQKQTIAAKKVAQAPAVTPPAARQSAAARDTRVMQANVERLRKNPSNNQAALEALAQFE